jgi:hypothetical protein
MAVTGLARQMAVWRQLSINSMLLMAFFGMTALMAPT